MRYGLGGGSQGVGGSYSSTLPVVNDPAPGGTAMQPIGVALGGGVSDIAQGRLSLIMLDTIIIAAIAFYLWTHKVQRGG